jgi:hypothetical protein
MFKKQGIQIISYIIGDFSLEKESVIVKLIRKAADSTTLYKTKDNKG